MTTYYISPATPTGPFISGGTLYGRAQGEILDLNNLGSTPNTSLPIDYYYFTSSTRFDIYYGLVTDYTWYGRYQTGAGPFVAVLTVYAGDGDDRITGSSSSDWLSGDAGADTIAGASGFSTAGDTIDGGAGNDLIRGADGNDRIEGGDGTDSISGGEGADTIVDNGRFVFSYDDSIDGGGGADSIVAGDGRDSLNGGAGNDTLLGGLIGRHGRRPGGRRTVAALHGGWLIRSRLPGATVRTAIQPLRPSSTGLARGPTPSPAWGRRS